MRMERLFVLVIILVLLFSILATAPAEAGIIHTEGSGDLDGNDKVDANDIRGMISIVLGKRAPTPKEIENADIDGDGSITVKDLVLNIRSHIKGTCSDGTPRGKCSRIPPLYCNENGIPEEDCQRCECLEGYECLDDGTCKWVGSEDRQGKECTETDEGHDIYLKGSLTYEGETREDQCDSSGTKVNEFYCEREDPLESNWVGCPPGYSCEEGECVSAAPGNVCRDGTPYGECSLYKPGYCKNGVLIDACGDPYNCGCPPGSECQSDGSCSFAQASASDSNIQEMITCDDKGICTSSGSMDYTLGEGETEEYEGFIVEYTDNSLTEEMREMEDEAMEAWWYYTLLRAFFYNDDTINSRLKEQENTLEARKYMLERYINSTLREDLEIESDFKISISGAFLDITSEEAEKLRELSYVKNVYPNQKVKATLMDSVGIIEALNLDSSGNDCMESGRKCLTGEGTTIAVIDTGIDYTHPDFGGCTENEFLKGNCGKVVGGYDFVNDDNDPMDDYGHGTHCAGIAAGDGSLKGAAPGAKLYAYKVLNEWGSGTTEWVIKGIERAMDPDEDGDFSDHVDVISMSLGGPGDPENPMSKAVNNAVGEGVTVVVAAGNNGPAKKTIASPANAERTITVGATDKKDDIAVFSSRGPVEWTSDGEEKNIMKPDIAAPGVDICSAQYDGIDESSECYDSDHITMSGTSMSAPHVAGAAALLKEAHPEWGPDEIKTALMASSDDVGDDAFAQGAGRINVANALKTVPGSEGEIRVESPGTISSPKFDIKGGINVQGFSGYDLSIAKSGVLGGSVSWDIVKDSNFLPADEYLARDVPRPSVYGWHIIRLRVSTSAGTSTAYSYLFNRKGERIELMDGWPQSPFSHSTGFWGVGSTPILRDLDKDGDKEIITFSRNQITIWNHDGTILPGWPKKTVNGLLTSGAVNPPSIGDIDGDGEDEIVVFDFWRTIFENGEVCGYAWNVDGSSVEGWKNKCPSSSDVSGSTSGINSMHDIDGDGDGDGEIITVVQDSIEEKNSIYVVQGNGRVAEGWPKTYDYDIENDLFVSLSFPVTEDLDGDGEIEIAVLRKDYYMSRGSCKGKLIFFDKHGDIEKEIKTPCDILMRDTLMAVDTDGDGIKEIGFADWNENVDFYDYDGNKPDGWPFRNYGYQKSYLVASDLTGNGKPEIIFPAHHRVSYSDEYVYVLNSEGEVLPGWPQKIQGLSLWTRPQVADVNGDGEPEILVTTTNGILYAFDSDGDNVKGFPILLDGPSNSGTAVDDVDGDGHPELFAGMHDGTVYGWRIKTEHSPERMEWPMWKHDPQNTGLYETPPAEFCRDRTPYGECSLYKPGYCKNGVLIDACGDPYNCGCPEGEVCQSDGSCSSPDCGDGKREGNEECDDGNNVNGDGCSSDCRDETDCPGGQCSADVGEGETELTGNEPYRCPDERPHCVSCGEDYEWDSGNSDCETAGCSDGTPLGECSSDKPKYCDENGKLLENYCYGPDQLVGTNDDCGCPEGEVCQSDGSCMRPECGNGVAEGSEECDTKDLKESSCMDFGFYGGSLSCKTDCTLDTSECVMDGVLGRFATWGGKVNVHTNAAGEWEVDSDCRSGENENDIEYCRKFWPDTAEIQRVEVSSELKPFMTSGCRATYWRKGEKEYECLRGAPAAECSDGTPLGECSSDKPKYCDENGKLLENYCYGPDQLVGTNDDCGCPEGEVCQSDGSCSSPDCGDGKREGNEECDDGNNVNGDGCSSDCRDETDCPGGQCSADVGEGETELTGNEPYRCPDERPHCVSCGEDYEWDSGTGDCELVEPQDTQVIDLKGNFINYVSFHVLPDSRNARDVFEVEGDYQLYAYDDSNYYYTHPDSLYDEIDGAQGWIEELYPSEGYRVYVNKDMQITVSGNTVRSDISIPMKKSKTNMIGYPFDYEQGIEEVFREIEDGLVIVMDNEGNQYTPDHGTNTIGTLKPGEAYYVSVEEDCYLLFGCGNEELQEGEECDDGNGINGDGCSSYCQIETDCPGGQCSADVGEGETELTGNEPYRCPDERPHCVSCDQGYQWNSQTSDCDAISPEEQTVTLTAVEDTWIEKYSSNQGNNKIMLIDKHFNFPKKRSLVRFDLSSMPQGAVINSATMKLYHLNTHCYLDGTLRSINVNVNQVMKEWKEGEATSIKATNMQDWSAEYMELGTDAKPSPEDTVNIGTSNGIKEFDLTSMVGDWVSGEEPNYGVLIWTPNEDYDDCDRRFATSEHDYANRRPMLVVSYQWQNVCGDGVAVSGEECDGDDLNGKDCTDLGFDGGTLSCSGDCTFDTGGCYGEEVLGRFATWCGKVNVHTENGEWVVDSDCLSGCEKNDIDYCRKFWPETDEIREVSVSDTMKPFMGSYCDSTYYSKGHHEYKCIKEI